MKTRSLLLTVIVLALASNLFGQRYCGLQLNLAELEQSDPVRYQRFMALENQTQKSVQNTKGIPCQARNDVVGGFKRSNGEIRSNTKRAGSEMNSEPVIEGNGCYMHTCLHFIQLHKS